MKIHTFYKILLAVLLCAALVAVFAACKDEDVKEALDALTGQPGTEQTGTEQTGTEQGQTPTDTTPTSDSTQGETPSGGNTQGQTQSGGEQTQSGDNTQGQTQSGGGQSTPAAQMPDLTAAQLVSAPDFTITDTTLSMTVANNVESYSFIGKVTVSEGATWQISTDIYGRDSAPTKTVPLNVGDNTFYLLVTSGDGEHISLYTVAIHRVAVYTVTFDTADGTAVAAQQVEEGHLATRPAVDPERGGYVFTGWDYDFSTPVTTARVITATWESCFIRYDGTITGLTDYAKQNVTALTIPTAIDGVAITAVYEYAFQNCTGLTSVTIGNGVTSIGRGAFADCTGMTSITIGNGVTSIGYGAFYGCTGLTAVYITDLATWCGISFEDYSANPLYWAQNLYINGELLTTEITIPNGVTSIGAYAFYGCRGLENITIPDSVTNIGNHVFCGCTGLTSVTLGNGITSINVGTFSGCTGLTSITFPDSVMSVGPIAFSGCSNLTSVTLGSGVTSIWQGSFSGCNNLTYNTYGNAKYLGNATNPYAVLVVATSTDITSCTIHTDTKVIANGAFSRCSNLTSITIGSGVTRIDSYAFENCTGLTSITYQGTRAQWNAISKGGDWNSNTGSYTIHCTDGNIAKS